MHEKRPLAPTSGDLVILTAISTIFPTSDHFHQVATPAMLCMAQYLGQKVPHTLSDLVTGTYVASLALQYQILSKRCIPEVVNYIYTTVDALMPSKATSFSSPRAPAPHHAMPASLHISSHQKQVVFPDRELRFWDTLPATDVADENNDQLKASLLKTHFDLVIQVTQIWRSKSALLEIIEPITELLERFELNGKPLEPFKTTKVRHCSLLVGHC